MELLLVLCLCISTWTGKTLGDENDIPCVNATAGSDAILNCALPDHTPQFFDWKKSDTTPAQEVFLYDNGKHYNNGKDGQHENFKNRVEFFQDQLQFGNASIRINNTQMTDSGIYSCEFPNLQTPRPKSYVKLVVVCIDLKDRTLEMPGQKPIFSSKKADGHIEVTCSVSGASKVKMELPNSDDGTEGHLVESSPSEDPQDFIFHVTKEGHYCCLVKYIEDCYKICSDNNYLNPGTPNRAEGEKKIKLNLLLLLVVVGLLLP